MLWKEGCYTQFSVYYIVHKCLSEGWLSLLLFSQHDLEENNGKEGGLKGFPGDSILVEFLSEMYILHATTQMKAL